ncbi:MAG TPA: RNA ligase partner protein, partial [Methanobacteriales archaeon]|nr:RNA ligase partner protein [Methanobacteriales archaeon]
GIQVWAERLGLRFLDAISFPKMLEEYLKYYE